MASMIEDAANTAGPPAVATVARCWRYPVKSMQGLEVDEVRLTATGVVGDRTHGLLDGTDGHLLSAKRTSALLGAWATDDTVTLPDGVTLGLDDPALDEILSAWLDRPVNLATPAEAGTGEVSYRMTFDPPDDEAEAFDIPVPAGTFLDLAAVHVVTAATLDGCKAARPDLDWDVRRFRPNLLLDTDGPAFVEDGWAGRELRFGEVVLAVDGPTVRCAMPLRAQPGGIERQPELFAAMSDLNEAAPNHLGVYCRVITPGLIRTGDTVELR
ncbi:MOSC domain-containing protein [soil metagenome]